MGLLVRYLQSLNRGDLIDQRIINTIIPRPSHALNTWENKYAMNHVFKFTYVPWVTDGISYGICPLNYDFLSSGFSGCYMAVYTDFTDGTHNGAHIHKGGSKDQGYNWNNYINSLDNAKGILFKPNYKDVPSFKGFNGGKGELWGVISDCELCYSVWVYSRNGNYQLESIERGRTESDLIIPRIIRIQP